MKSELAENIKNFRKDRKLTQEQLAEVMGVTTGAVHKWEAGSSIPDLSIIMELADFFDVSVDVLLGFKLKDNGQEATIHRLFEYSMTMDAQGLKEAEKALKKYPNSFEVVVACADIYLRFGTGNNKEWIRRALELLEQALVLLPQNKDPKISALSIFGKMANAYLLLGELEKSVEFLKKHNECGIFSDMIGAELSFFMKRYDEAAPFLTESLINSISILMNTISGLYASLCAKKDYEAAIDIIEWGQEIVNKVWLTKDDAHDYFNKNKALDLILIANVKLLMGRPDEVPGLLKEADRLAESFDALPDFGVRSMRYVGELKEVSIHDSLGVTAEESIKEMLDLIGNNELTEMWMKVREKSEGKEMKKIIKEKKWV